MILLHYVYAWHEERDRCLGGSSIVAMNLPCCFHFVPQEVFSTSLGRLSTQYPKYPSQEQTVPNCPYRADSGTVSVSLGPELIRKMANLFGSSSRCVVGRESEVPRGSESSEDPLHLVSNQSSTAGFIYCAFGEGYIRTLRIAHELCIIPKSLISCILWSKKSKSNQHGKLSTSSLFSIIR